MHFCYGTPPQTWTEKMQGLSLPRLPIASVEHNDLTDNRRLYQFAYFPIMVGKAGLEPANSGSLSKEISTGSGMVRIAGFKPAISWSRIMRSSSSCPISGYNGGIDEHRTRNLLSARQVLSQLSYNPINGAPRSNRTAIWWLQVNCNNHYTTGANLVELMGNAPIWFPHCKWGRHPMHLQAPKNKTADAYKRLRNLLISFF